MSAEIIPFPAIVPEPKGEERYVRVTWRGKYAEVWEWSGKHGRNLTIAYGLSFRTLAQAKEWARSYAEKHGLSLREGINGDD